jgi:amphi-Trp domain-containing protein
VILGGRADVETRHMSDIEFSRSQSLSRADAAKLFTALAEALGGGESDVELYLGDAKLKLRVPDKVRVEVEVEVERDEVELEIELKWSFAAPHPTQNSAAST